MSITNVKQVGNAANHQAKEGANASAMTPELQATIGAFRKHLDLPDPGPLLVALATVAANRIDGDPVWLLQVGPPSSGKTEILQSLTALSDVHPVGQVTEAGLLSGTSRKDVEPGASGGLLMRIGIRGQGIILFKDFGSILSMNRDAKRSVLAALREIHDQSWTRTLGTDGGRTYSWHGKVGAVGAVTEDIERQHSVMATMGERFLLYRMPRLDDAEREIRIQKALGHGSGVKQMRDDLKLAVYTLFKDGLQETNAANSEQNRVPTDLAMVVASWRSSVIRNGKSRDIEVVPETEVPTRIAKNFQQLQQGFSAVGLNESASSELLVRVGLDSIPLLRGKILRLLIEGPHSTYDISEELVGYSRTIIKRHLDEVKAHCGVVEKILVENQQPRWILPEKIAERLTRLGIGPVSQSANDGEQFTNNTRGSVADRSQPEMSETVSRSQSDGGTARVGVAERPIPEMSESREREGSREFRHQTKPVGTES